MAALGMFIAALAALTGAVILRGLVLQALWLWFVVDTFTLEPLTLVQAMGLSLIVAYLTYQYDAKKDEDDKTAAQLATEFVVVALVFNGFAYGAGALIHSFA